ncbi:class I SAM-dependent methyltransferase [Flagellatimonas centrodinii]|uniref:DUF938 domain-containing protein n=1 Tax=Flagellatimonas centrodinii TaxID=2806210 RepID=UPI001FEED103|nr:DUF938 domain-containing protein [Flagellatimonas centrodinii]ULQ47205.1 class I SAM-dependent methyltransferase [Flagellatimonas centrodinii]
MSRSELPSPPPSSDSATVAMDKPFAPAAERNAPHILAILQPLLATAGTVFEVGSGTGQHAVHFARHLPWLRWQTADQRIHHAGIRAWLEEAGLPNVAPPLPLEIGLDPWPEQVFDAVYSANTLHYMPWSAVEALFAAVPTLLRSGGVLAVYGPFRINGHWLSPNDEAFDAQLKAGAAFRGLRDLEAVEVLARAAGLRREALHAMPADNRLVIWRSL